MESTFDIMILGLSPQGLFLLREYSKAGKKVVAVGLQGSVGSYSTYGRIITISDLMEVEEIFSKYINDKTRVHITSDPFLNYLIDKDHKIYKTNQCFPNYKSAVVFSDKILTENLAKNLDISSPKSYRLSEINIDRYDIYPSIIKWNRRYPGEEFKTILVKNSKDLKKVKGKINSDEHLIIQKYIPGEPDADLSYGGYLINGKEILSIIVEQKKQYPYPNGLASFVRQYHGDFEEPIRIIARKILSGINYSGFVEVECRIDKAERKVYLIEVNPRACGWIKILKRKYINFNVAVEGVPPIYHHGEICWVNLVRDIRAIIDLLRKNPNEFKFRDILKDYFKFPIMDIFELNDLSPFICQLRKIFQ